MAVVSVAAAGTSPASPMSTRPILEVNLLAEVNRLRVSHGLVPLRPNKALAAAADQHSFEMATAGYFAHDGLTGPYSRRLASYYRAPRHGVWMVGENLVWGSPTIGAREAVRLWLRSPVHRGNLFRRQWREAGVSAVHAQAAPGAFQGLEVTVITLDFGLRN